MAVNVTVNYQKFRLQTGVGIQTSKGLVCPAVIILDFESRGDLGMVQSSINRVVIRQKIGLVGRGRENFSLAASPFLPMPYALQAKQTGTVTLPSPPKNACSASCFLY